MDRINCNNDYATYKTKQTKPIWLKWIILLLACMFIFYYPLNRITFSILLILPVLTILQNGFRWSSFVTWITITKRNLRLGNVYNIIIWLLLFKILLLFRIENSFFVSFIISIVLVMFLIIVFLPFAKIVKNSRLGKAIYFLILLNITLYVFTAIIGVNCIFDESSPIIYKVKIEGKYYTVNRFRGGRTYYFKLAPWGNLKNAQRIKIVESLYEEINIGDVVKCNHKEGALNIGWYYFPEIAGLIRQ